MSSHFHFRYLLWWQYRKLIFMVLWEGVSSLASKTKHGGQKVMLHWNGFLRLKLERIFSHGEVQYLAVKYRVKNMQKCVAYSEAYPNEQEKLQELALEIYDLIRVIRDPEKPNTLEDLAVVNEDSISVTPLNDGYHIAITFVPTIPHCSLATLIGLTLRVKLERYFPHQFKLDIFIKEGSHSTGQEITKQINDKERIAAAMENPNLRKLVESCVEEFD